MICIIALIVFAIMAIFSARYRPLAAEAFDCVFRRVTFRKCTSGLDKRLKAQLTGKAMRKHKSLGKFLYKYFEVFSWLFLILFFLSLWQTGVAVYNYVEYGNCNGPGEGGFCVFDPMGHNGAVSETGVCPAPGTTPIGGELSAPNQTVIENNPRTGSSDALVTVVEYGCFSCPNTARQADAVKSIIEHYGAEIEFSYVNFPLSTHDFAEEASRAAICVDKQDPLLFWKYYFILLEKQEDFNEMNLKMWALELGVDQDLYELCLMNNETDWAMQANIDASMASGIYGTPSFFINDESYVGVQTEKTLKKLIDDALEK